MRLLRAIEQYLCPHKDMIRKTQHNRLYVECMSCGLESKGITLQH